jgi:hypothetical protein
VCDMQVPETFGGLWRQRQRWARGLAQVLRRHVGLFGDWRTRRLWPVYAEAVSSILWANLAIGMIAFWGLSYAVGLAPLGASPLPSFWGMVIATVALVQLGVGVWLDGRYNRGVGRFYLWAALYPLFYWLVMLVVTVTATPKALLGRRRATQHWRTARVPAGDAVATPVHLPVAPVHAPAPPAHPVPAVLGAMGAAAATGLAVRVAESDSVRRRVRRMRRVRRAHGIGRATLGFSMLSFLLVVIGLSSERSGRPPRS